MDLEPGEHIIFQGHPSWRSILGFYLKGLVIVVIATFVGSPETKPRAASSAAVNGL
jgi:hypothetical protein